VGYGLLNVVVCVVFGSEWMTRFHSCRRTSNNEQLLSLNARNETPIGINQKFLAVHGEDTVNLSTMRCWVRKSGDSGGSLDPNDQPRTGKFVTTTHNLKRQIVVELFQNVDEFIRGPLQRC
jgi:hypothetical protein